jgi:hypothetical protein
MQDNNHLTGTIPTELGNLKLLSSLNLNEDKLSGLLLAELQGLKNLDTSILSGFG